MYAAAYGTFRIHGNTNAGFHQTGCVGGDGENFAFIDLRMSDSISTEAADTVLTDIIQCGSVRGTLYQAVYSDSYYHSCVNIRSPRIRRGLWNPNFLVTGSITWYHVMAGR